MRPIIAGRLDDMPPQVRLGLGAFRYEVFVKRLCWQLPDADAAGAIEWDRFDRTDTVHVVSLDAAGQICGCARLMPTTKPYLLQTLQAHASNLALPCCPSVWELSRFAARPSQNPSTDSLPGMQFFPSILAIAATLGASRVIGAVSYAIARLYRRFGLELHTIATTGHTRASGYLVCAIDLSAQTLQNLGYDASALMRTVMWVGQGPMAPTPASTADSAVPHHQGHTTI